MYKFAIIGCGDAGRRHAEQIQKHGHLLAVCDVDASKAYEFAQLFEARSWYTIDDLLRNEPEVEIVVVCSPNGYHAEHCIKSLQAGRHVLCESPLCLTNAAAWQMIETEKFCGKKLFVVNAASFNTELDALKRVIEDHTTDHFYSFDLKCTTDLAPDPEKEWQTTMFPGGGALYTHFTDYVDALVYLFGDIEEVKGFSDNLSHKDLLEFEDSAEAALKMKNGIPGNLSWSLNDNEHVEAALQILTLEDPLSLGDLEKIVSQQNRYEKIYDWFSKALDTGKASNLYQAMQTVDAIEKTYKAVSSNHSGH